jgi:DNA-directed RNA polymerase subunit RPC12/RpoP
MVGVLCYDCGALNAGSTKFCVECGTSMAVRDHGVLCPACNSLNAAGAKFCVECGGALAKIDGRQAITCPSCGSLNAAGAKFCVECGAALARIDGRQAVTCPSCGSLNGVGAKFCVECGAALARIDGRQAITCPSCRSLNAAGAKFCVECGAALTARVASTARPMRSFESLPVPISQWAMRWREQANLPEASPRVAVAAFIIVAALAVYAVAPSTALLALIYVATSALAGFALVQRLLPQLPRLVRLCGGYLAGVVLTAWATFLPALALSPLTESTLIIAVFVATALNAGIIAFFWPELDRLAPRAAPFVAVIAAWAVVRIAVPNQWESPIPLILLILLGAAAVTLALRQHLLTDERRTLAFELILLAAALVFSTWLMDARLSGSPLTVSSNTWGDTGLHVSLARSFSEGHNYPPEYPFYGGEPIRYHFGYDFFAGALEEAGLPIRLAFNLPGALGFTALILLVFELARWLFRNVAVGLMAVVLLITNGSFAFLRYFQLYNVSSVFDFAGISKAVSHLWDRQPAPFSDRYLAVGPYFVEGRVDKISIFWTLNVFLTQTHLIVAMATVIFLAYAIIRPLRETGHLSTTRSLALGILMGLTFWLNGILFMGATVFFLAFFFLHGPRAGLLPLLVPPFAVLMLFGYEIDGHFYFLALLFALGSLALLSDLRQSLPFLGAAGVLALPQAIWLNGGLSNDGGLREHTGYLVDNFRFDHLGSYGDFIEYWWLNLGLALPLMAIAAFWLKGADRKLMLAVIAIFIFGNFVQASRDLGGHNHKIFNLWEILMNVFVAFAFVRIWTLLARDIKLSDVTIPKRFALAVPATLLSAVFVLLVLSGIIDFMVIKNDFRVDVFGDKQSTVEAIERYTDKDSLFLTAYGDLYTAPALAGRRLFLGYQPWAASAGYDVPRREAATKAIYGAPSKDEACRLLVSEGIDYVQLGPAERSKGLTINEAIFRGFVTAVTVDVPNGGVAVYDVHKSCPGAAAYSP